MHSCVVIGIYMEILIFTFMCMLQMNECFEVFWKFMSHLFICNHVSLALEGVFLVDFSAENLNLSPNELTTRLNDTLIRCQEELHKVEELRKG